MIKWLFSKPALFTRSGTELKIRIAEDSHARGSLLEINQDELTCVDWQECPILLTLQRMHQTSENAFGSTRTPPGPDGGNHCRMCKAVKGSYSCSALTNRFVREDAE
jgi:hypothetical protein